MKSEKNDQNFFFLRFQSVIDSLRISKSTFSSNNNPKFLIGTVVRHFPGWRSALRS